MDDKLERINKKAQVALWIILALALVAAITLFLLVQADRDPGILSGSSTNVRAAIDTCIRQTVTDTASKLLPQGGLLEPKHYKDFRKTRVEYLCDTSAVFNTCINQHPLLINEIKEEILIELRPAVNSCLGNIKEELERRNYEVSIENTEVNLSIAPGKILVELPGKISINNGGRNEVFDGFDISVSSPTYELATLAMEIASQESVYCYFEYVGYMLLHPEIGIEKNLLEDSTKIYTLTDKQSKQEMNIAIRSCVIPPGI